MLRGYVYLKSQVIGLIQEKKIPKGDVLEAAKIAGIFAAKKTPEIIPLCHPIPIESAGCRVLFRKRQDKNSFGHKRKRQDRL